MLSLGELKQSNKRSISVANKKIESKQSRILLDKNRLYFPGIRSISYHSLFCLPKTFLSYRSLQSFFSCMRFSHTLRIELHKMGIERRCNETYKITMRFFIEELMFSIHILIRIYVESTIYKNAEMEH